MALSPRSDFSESSASVLAWWVVACVGLGLLLIAASLALLAARALYWLQQDQWTNSLCELAQAFSLNTQACSVNRSWLGFNRLYEYVAWHLDGSLTLLGLGITSFALCWVMLLPLMALLALIDRLEHATQKKRVK